MLLLSLCLSRILFDIDRVLFVSLLCKVVGECGRFLLQLRRDLSQI